MGEKTDKRPGLVHFLKKISSTEKTQVKKALKRSLQIGSQLNFYLAKETVDTYTVWPEIEIKRSPVFPKVAQEVALPIGLKRDVFTTAQNVTKHLGYYCNKISYLEFPKIAQSSHMLFV